MKRAGFAAVVTLVLGLFVVAAFPSSATALEATSCSAIPSLIDRFTVAYGDDAQAQSLDLYAPDGVKGEPIVLFVHGGAWSHGDKSQYDELGNAFAACGIAFAVVNYTLAPLARVDAQAADVAAALRYVSDSAGGDSYARNRVFLFGHSAGAQLAMYVAADAGGVLARAGLTKRAIAGVVAMEGTGYGPSSLTHGIALNPFRMFALTSAFGNELSKWKAYDIGQYLTGREPPVLVVHATGDTIAPQYESADLVDELQKAGDPVRYLQPAGLDHFKVLHEMTDGSGDPMFEAVAQFVVSS